MAYSRSQIDVAPHGNFVPTISTGKIEQWLEAERERVGLWVPVALGSGIGAWFALPDDKLWAGWIVLCCLLALVALGAPRGGRIRLILASGALLAATGCALVWAKALAFGEPPLARAVFAQFEVRVIQVEPQPALERVRLLVEPVRQRSKQLPSHIRVNVANADMPGGIGAGSIIAIRARLMPPPSPAVPGAYNFAEIAYFSGIGATGRVLPPIRIIAAHGDSTGGMRQRLATHIRSRLPPAEGAIAVTLATGDRGSISERDAQAMRRSGLAHLLSISGLHVTALIGAFILVIYRLLALSPRLALSLPLMLIAAGGGAAAGVSYTLFTGAAVPTVRACIAALLVLGGLALGREAISLRLVAVGAVVVLFLWPEALVGPSFQMSFAAITVIVALIESQWFRRLTHAREESRLRKAGRAVLALFLTGLVVELALMPIALFHFHQAGLLGALANLIAIPLTTFIVMPTEALALLFDIFGLGAPFWWIAGKALALFLAVAHHVAANPFAVWALPHFPAGALVAGALGCLWLMLWSTRIRYFGLPIALVGGLVMVLAPTPDVLVTGDGRHMAVRQADGRLALLRGRAGSYVRDVLAGSAGFGEDAGEALPSLAEAHNVQCSPDLCSVLVRGTDRDWLILATRSGLHVPWRALIDACARADIVVSDRRLPRACAPRWLRLDRARLAQTGGVALYLDQEKLVSVIRPGDRHPWVGAR